MRCECAFADPITSVLPQLCARLSSVSAGLGVQVRKYQFGQGCRSVLELDCACALDFVHLMLFRHTLKSDGNLRSGGDVCDRPDLVYDVH